MITKITFAIQCASIVMALILAHEYHDAKALNAAKLAAAIAQANDEAWELAQNKDYQYAIYQEQVAPYTKAIPAATLKEIKARPR
jgi:hypothetical protein